MNNQIRLNIPENFNFTENQDILSPQYIYLKDSAKIQTVTFYDTFDWRIYHAGLVLFSTGKIFSLRLIESEIVIAKCGYQKRPIFIWDFAQNEVKKHLESVIGIRALMLKCTAEFSQEDGYILNNDQKTVCKIFIRKIIPSKKLQSEIQYHTLTMIPLKGYHTDLRKIRSKLNPFVIDSNIPDPLFSILQLNNIIPEEYATKISIKLKRDLPAQTAMKSILKIFLHTIRCNEQGIIEDIDIEFLHDFRVAIRRTRAALSLLQEVFPSAITKKFKKDFSFIGKKSNILRDLDVYLLNEKIYKNTIPDQFKKPLSFLFDQLRDERKNAHQDFVDLLNSQRYKNIINGWQKFLDFETIDNDTTPRKAKHPIILLAKPIILNQLKMILKLGSEINDETEDKKVHILRLECKKLRYLLEFFSSLFPKNRVVKFIDHLKILQDNLGKFNDYSIQQEFLQKYLRQLSLTNIKNRQLIAALGALIGVLYDRQLKTRQEFSICCSQFTSPENINLAMKLFKN
jgi:CHAD domain-containing protein